MVKVVIIMPYYERLAQLKKTLDTIKQSSVKDYQIVITDDASPIPLQLGNPNVHIIRVKPEDKKWTNPEPAYNMAFEYALKNYNPEIIISQNPECFHYGDVLKYAVENTTRSNYIAFGCYSIGQGVKFDGVTNDRSVTHDGDDGWYNHPAYRPVAYEFCAAIHVDNLRLMNGYDERFAFGGGYGDDYFLHRIRLMGLDVQIPVNPFVVHQWHSHAHQENSMRSHLVELNRNLFHKLKAENQIKAEHLLTNDICE